MSFHSSPHGRDAHATVLGVGLHIACWLGAAAATPPEIPRESLPPKLRDVNLSRISGGLYLAIAQTAGTVAVPDYPKMEASTRGRGGLDPRLGPNTVLGADPAPLPPGQSAQAEPHIARNPANPLNLIGTFQEGRFTNGGALDIGYATSLDGGRTWVRALLPGLTTTVGGTYNRASDPVVAFDGTGRAYLSVLGIRTSGSNITAIELLCSASTDGGLNWANPVLAMAEPADGSLDKNWIAVNTFAGTPHAGRVVMTLVTFLAAGGPQIATYSDDGGAHWTPRAFVTTTTTSTQGCQPYFLPDGRFRVAYYDFDTSLLMLSKSADGGATFDTANQVVVMPVDLYDAPQVRDGSFLPSLAVDPVTGAVVVVVQGLVAGVPRVTFSRSEDGGDTWSAPMAINDPPPPEDADGIPCWNPTVGISPGGEHIQVSFHDVRNDPAQSDLMDLWMAESFDGGATWGPDIRLSDTTTDMTRAPLTGAGYMLGDYNGFAASVGQNHPGVPIWCDTRNQTPDPFAVRVFDAAPPPVPEGYLIR